MHKKLISTIALGLIVGATTINVNANQKLSDINGHWANKEIQDFVSKGYLKGYPDGTFKPDKTISRAEFVRIVNNYFGFNNNKGNENFSDVNSSDWFYNDICIAQKEGYINGYTDGTFKPNKTITREEASKIIVSIKNSEDVNIDKINNFTDGYMVSEWAKKYVEGAIESGYIKGDTNGKINPVSNITRAESVSMISRVSQHTDILPNRAPVVYAWPVVIKQGDNFDYSMLKAIATDPDGDEVEITYEGTVDTSKPGQYHITVTATDSKGASSSMIVGVNVAEDVKESYNPNSSEFKSAVASNMISLVNAHRAANGKEAAKHESRLDGLANEWSKYMADNGFFDHVAPNGTTANSAFPQYGTTSGENIALTHLNPSGDMQQDARNLANRLFGMWKKSAGHNANMLSDYCNRIGFGIHAVEQGQGVYSIYATQEFDYKWTPDAPVASI